MAKHDTNIVYYNARVHGMRSGLFDRAALEDLLSHQRVDRMSDALLESSYRGEMSEALTRFSGADAIEDATSRNLAHTFQKLTNRAQGGFRTLVETFLMRWDLIAVKSLLRCQHHGVRGDDAMQGLIAGPTLSQPILKEMADYESMANLVNALLGWNRELCRGLRKALPLYEERHDLSILEDALDRAYFVDHTSQFAHLNDENAQALRFEMQVEIDRINLRTLYQHFESKRDKETLEARVLPGGLLSSQRILQMANASDWAGAVELLGNTRYGGLVEELFQVMQTGRFSPVERYFERIMMREIRKRSRAQVFSLAVLIDYVWLKYNEVVNLRLIARGLSGSLPVGRVKEELYFPA